MSADEIQMLIELRAAALKANNFEQANYILNQLRAMGIVLKDNPDGTTTWEEKR